MLLHVRFHTVRLMFIVVALLVLAGRPAASAPLYDVKKIDDRTYAAIADPDGTASSNAVILVTQTCVVLAGAHFTSDAVAELTRAIAGITPLPLRYTILTHHHRGYNHVDFDFPPTIEIITSTQTLKVLRSERRELKNLSFSFDKGMALHMGKQTILLNSMEAGHTDGDVVVYLPDQAVLFTSDLFFNEEAGFMANGHAREWVSNLTQLEHLVATRVVPGRGGVTDSAGLRRFRSFFQEFLTEVLAHVDRGESAAETVRSFSLPSGHAPPNFSRYQTENIEWAWRELNRPQ